MIWENIAAALTLGIPSLLFLWLLFRKRSDPNRVWARIIASNPDGSYQWEEWNPSGRKSRGRSGVAWEVNGCSGVPVGETVHLVYVSGGSFFFFSAVRD